jgi:hypothetical protein
MTFTEEYIQLVTRKEDLFKSFSSDDIKNPITSQSFLEAQKNINRKIIEMGYNL